MKAIQPADVAVPRAPYSPVVVSGGLVVLSGQVPFNADGELVSGGFEEQAEQVFQNMEACLSSAGCTTTDVLKVTAYIASWDDFDLYNEIYRRHFQEPYPVRTTVQAQLHGFRVEVDAIAQRPA